MMVQIKDEVSSGCLAPASFFLEQKESHRRIARHPKALLTDVELESLRKAESKRNRKKAKNLRQQK